MDNYITLFYNITTSFVLYYLQKDWENTDKHFKKFQKKLIDYNYYSKSQKKTFIEEKFYTFIKKNGNYNLSKSDFKQIYLNFFSELVNALLYENISKKDIAIFKLKNPTFFNTNKIDFDIPKINDFIFTIFKNSVKFTYNNVEIISQKNNFTLKNNILEIIKNKIYSFIPITDILRIQNFITSSNVNSDDNSSENVELNVNSNINSSINSNENSSVNSELIKFDKNINSSDNSELIKFDKNINSSDNSELFKKKFDKNINSSVNSSVNSNVNSSVNSELFKKFDKTTNSSINSSENENNVELNYIENVIDKSNANLKSVKLN